MGEEEEMINAGPQMLQLFFILEKILIWRLETSATSLLWARILGHYYSWIFANRKNDKPSGYLEITSLYQQLRSSVPVSVSSPGVAHAPAPL